MRQWWFLCFAACAQAEQALPAAEPVVAEKPGVQLPPAPSGPTTIGDTADRFVSVDLGSATVVDGVAGPFEVTVREGDASVMVVSRIADPETSLQLNQLLNPRGKFLAQGSLHFSHESRSVTSSGVQTALIPESPDADADFVPGTYSFEIDAMGTHAEGLDVHVFAFIKQKPPPDARHLIDINLFFTGSAGLTSQTAAANSRLVQAMQEVRRIWGQAGIAINQVRYFDLSDDFQTIVGSTPAQAPSHVASIADLFRMSYPAPKGLNFFFVEDLDPAPLLGMHGYILGVSGGIPGPGLTPGTDRSGVVVLFERAEWTPIHIGKYTIEDDWLGTTMAHEGGHFLGLSHIYERNPFTGKIMANDNMSDTPPGSDLAAANEYLMQPSATSNGGKISPLQARTLQRNPLVSFE